MPFVVDMEPVGRRGQASGNNTLLTVAQAAGVKLSTLCGGIGACDTCRVRLIDGKVSAPTLVEQGEFLPEQLRAGWRLACQTRPLSDVKIHIPPESLSLPQRLQLEGEAQQIALDPVVTALDLYIPAPSTTDLRSDLTRVNDTLNGMGLQSISASVPMLAHLSQRLRAAHWSARLAIRHMTTLVGVLSPGHPPLGLAVDIGTTSIAAYLVNLESGAILMKTGAMNPQIAYGEDVISRIMVIGQRAGHDKVLQECLVITLNEIAHQLCDSVGATVDEIMEVVLVGNTAMHHIIAGLPVRQLGEAPYVAVHSDALEFPACSIGFTVSPGAIVHLPPLIAGYVGADHIAALLATNLWRKLRTALVIDIGTNSEVTLAHRGRFYSCSCASGPAFEGAHIRDGMRAAAGAIERVRIIDNHVYLQTIDNAPPVGLCGSGILDAVAAMADAGLIGKRGAFQRGHPLLNDSNTFVLAPAESTAQGRDIVITRKDVSEIQLAKSAIRTGIDLLLDTAEIKAQEIEEFVIAGAFGTYINVDSALRIGMFPAMPPDRIRQVGNAAGMGAVHLLVSWAAREQAQQLARNANYVELTTHPKFQDTFVQNLEL